MNIFSPQLKNWFVLSYNGSLSIEELIVVYSCCVRSFLLMVWAAVFAPSVVWGPRLYLPLRKKKCIDAVRRETRHGVPQKILIEERCSATLVVLFVAWENKNHRLKNVYFVSLNKVKSFISTSCALLLWVLGKYFLIKIEAFFGLWFWLPLLQSNGFP